MTCYVAATVTSLRYFSGYINKSKNNGNKYAKALIDLYMSNKSNADNNFQTFIKTMINYTKILADPPFTTIGCGKDAFIATDFFIGNIEELKKIFTFKIIQKNKMTNKIFDDYNSNYLEFQKDPKIINNTISHIMKYSLNLIYSQENIDDAINSRNISNKNQYESYWIFSQYLFCKVTDASEGNYSVIDTLEIKYDKYKFNIIACIRGGTGHAISYVKDGNQWHNYNDSMVTNLTENEMIGKNVNYIIFKIT